MEQLTLVLHYIPLGSFHEVSVYFEFTFADSLFLLQPQRPLGTDSNDIDPDRRSRRALMAWLLGSVANQLDDLRHSSSSDSSSHSSLPRSFECVRLRFETWSSTSDQHSDPSLPRPGSFPLLYRKSSTPNEMMSSLHSCKDLPCAGKSRSD
jgi:hypothetical protein